MLIIFPKIDSYENLGYKSKQQFDRIVADLMSIINASMRPTFLVEDEVAVSYFKDYERAEWISLLMGTDTIVWSNISSNDARDIESLRAKATFDKSLCAKAASKFKYPPKFAALKGDARTEALRPITYRRMRFAAQETQDSAYNLLYVGNGNNFTSAPKMDGFGDGKGIINVDLREGISTYHVGGVNVNKEFFMEYLKMEV